MPINSDTYNVTSNIFKESTKDIDTFHFSVILPNASQCHKERNVLINQNNALKDIYKSFLSKLGKFHEASLDISANKQALNGEFDFTDNEIQIFKMSSFDYLHKMKINLEKLKFFNADSQIIQSYLKSMEKTQSEIINVENLFNNT